MKIFLFLSSLICLNAQVSVRTPPPKIESAKPTVEITADELLATKLEVILYKKALIEKTYETDLRKVMLEQEQIGQQLFERAKLSANEYDYDPRTRKFSKKSDNLKPVIGPSGAIVGKENSK